MINYNGFAKMSTTNENFVESPEFSCQGNRWSLYVYPGGDAFASGGMVSVQVCNKSNQPMCVNYFLSVRDSMGKEVLFNVLSPPCSSSRNKFNHRLAGWSVEDSFSSLSVPISVVVLVSDLLLCFNEWDLFSFAENIHGHN